MLMERLHDHNGPINFIDGQLVVFGYMWEEDESENADKDMDDTFLNCSSPTVLRTRRLDRRRNQVRRNQAAAMFADPPRLVAGERLGR